MVIHDKDALRVVIISVACSITLIFVIDYFTWQMAPQTMSNSIPYATLWLVGLN